MSDPYGSQTPGIDVGGTDYEKQQKDLLKQFFVPDPSYAHDPLQDQPQTANPVDQWAFGEYLASKVQGMRPMSDKMIVSGADTHLWATVSPQQLFSVAGSEAANWFEGLYGGNISPWLQAALIPDKGKRDQAYAMLTTQDTTLTGIGEGTDPHAKTLGLTGISARYAASTAFLASRQDRTVDGHIVSNYDYDKVLTPQEQLLLTEAVRTSTTPTGIAERAIQVVSPFSTGKTSNALVRVEPGSNQFSLDEEWAKAHPVKALAAAKLLQEYNPGSNVRIGENGVVSNVLNAAGRPIDWVSGPIALAYRTASRAFGELSEAAGPGDRNQYLYTAQQIKDDIAKGLYDPADIPAAMRDYERYLDWGTPGNIQNEGETFSGTLHDIFMPETSGFGLAQSSADGIGLLPGDPAYGPWVAAVGLIHNFSSLDPLGWAGAAKQAKALAGTVRLGESEVRKAGTLKGFAAAKDSVDYLKSRNWAIIGAHLPDLTSSENAARHEELLRVATQFSNKKGYQVTHVAAPDGPKVMIFGIRGDEALNLSRSFEQPSFMSAEGIVHSNRTVTPVDWSLSSNAKVADPDAMNVTTETGFKTFALRSPDGAQPIKFAPPRVSSNWMTQYLFSKMYKTPDELLYGNQAREASEKIYDTIKTARDLGRAEAKAKGLAADGLLIAGEQRTMGVMAQWAPNFDEHIIKALAAARSPEDVHRVLISAVMGGISDPLQFDKMVQRMSEAGAELMRLDETLDTRSLLADQVQKLMADNGWTGTVSDADMATLSQLLKSADGTVIRMKRSEVDKYVDPQLWDPKTSMGVSDLPPVPEGYIRLFRGHSVVKGKLPDWLTTNTEGGMGRWFTDNRNNADWYAQRASKGKVSYVDVPKDEAAAARISTLGGEAARFSRDPQTEYLLSKERAATKQPAVVPKVGKLNKHDFEALKADIKANGIKEPLQIDFDPATGKALMSEGFHRWLVARRLGIKEIPVKITYADGVEGPKLLHGISPAKWSELPKTMPVSELKKAGNPIHGAGSGRQAFPGDWETPTRQQAGTWGSVEALTGSMLRNGWAPERSYATGIEVSYDANTGAFMVTNGHHRLLAAEAAGIKEVPVTWVGSSTRRDSMFDKVEAFKAENPSVKPLPKLMKTDLERGVDKFSELDKQVAAEDARRYELMAERLHMRSMIGLDDVSIPLRELPAKDMLKQLRRYAPESQRTTAERFFAALARYPGSVTTGDLIRAVKGEGLVGREATRVAKKGADYMEGRARELFMRFGHINQQLSGGRFIYMPLKEGKVVPKGQMADYVQSSLRAVNDHAKLFGLEDKDIQVLLSDYLKINNREDWFKFIKRLWQDVADKSPFLDAEGRRVLRQTHDELMYERGGGYLHGGDDMGFMQPRNTLDHEITDDMTGRKVRSGMPAFSADFMGNSMRLPANEVMMEYLAASRRWTRGLRARGKAGEVMSDSIQAGRDILNGFTYLWKSLILMGRMPFALLSRIQGEQGFRMAALDLASWSNHPLEWFKSVMRKGEYARFEDSHAAFLGTLMDNYNDVNGIGSKVRVWRKGRAVLQPNDGSAFFNALSSVFRRRHISPETVKLLFNKDPEKIIAWLHSDAAGPTGAALLENLESSSQGLIQGLKNMQEELKLLTSGRMDLTGGFHLGHVLNESGKPLEVGTRAFANFLQREYEAGRYQPPQYINARANEYTFGEGESLAARFRDWSFTQFYSRPDVFLSRGPMFRQLAVKEFKRLTSLGWTEKKAKAASEAYAAEQTSGWMYNLAARTSAQYFLRNMVPFFPAYQELANVWLRQLPGRYAAGVGHLYFARRASVLLNSFKSIGFIQTDAQGQDYFTVPGLDKVYEHLTGEKGSLLKFPVASAVGMLPVTPDALVPALGPVPSIILAQLAKHNTAIEQLSNIVLRYGNEVQIGPTSWNHLFHAAGITPPWEYLTSDTQKLMMTLSVEDALRSVSMDVGPAPAREDFKSQKAYEDAARTWSEDLVSRAHKRAGVHYITRALGGMLLPVSVQISNKYSEEMGGIWKAVEAYKSAKPNDSSAASPLIEAFKAKYPDAVWYTNGKTINQGQKRDYGDFDNFIHDWRDGKVKVMDPQEFIDWNLGMTQYWVYLTDHRRPTDGLSPPEILRNGFKINEDKAYAKDEWGTYLATHPSFNRLFAQFSNARDTQPVISNTLATEKLIAVKDQLVALDKLFTVNGIRDADYLKVIGKISENIDYVATKTTDPRWAAVNWWWKTVGIPTYTKIGNLYDQAFALPAPERGPVFEAIRRLENGMRPETHKGEKYPTPEEVSWGRKADPEQKLRRLEWITMPPQWLTRFQRGKSGIGGGSEVDKLYSFINDGTAKLKQWAADNYISPSSTAYQFNQDSLDKAIEDYAKSNNLERYLLYTKEPAFQRILMSKQYDGNKTFESIAAQARQVWDRIAAAGYSPSGSSQVAREGQVWLFQRIDQARQVDEQFKKLMERLEIAVAPSGRDSAPGYEMYFKVFFDYFGPTPTLPSSYNGG